MQKIEKIYTLEAIKAWAIRTLTPNNEKEFWAAFDKNQKYWESVRDRYDVTPLTKTFYSQHLEHDIEIEVGHVITLNQDYDWPNNLVCEEYQPWVDRYFQETGNIEQGPNSIISLNIVDEPYFLPTHVPYM
jgi:hypothetical protein